MTGIDPHEVNSIKRYAQAPISLEKPVGDEEQSEFGQLIADEQAESPYDRAAETLAQEALREALGKLSYRERRVIDCATGSAVSIRGRSTRSGARSTSPASGSAKSKATRSRSYKTSAKPNSCATTTTPLPAIRCTGSRTEPNAVEVRLPI